ncbi:hypothetical protein LEFCBN_LEFCBN_11710, partial [Dysosmobacter welbionis]
QMLLRQIDENGKNHGRRSGGGVEILVLDGGVDAGICRGLNGFQQGKEPAQRIGHVRCIRIQGHLQDLLWYVWIFVFGSFCKLLVVGFYDGCPPPSDLPLRPDPKGRAVQQRGGIPGIGQDC